MYLIEHEYKVKQHYADSHMHKQFILMKLKNLFLTLHNTPESDHIRYIYHQLRHDYITPSEALEKAYQLLD